MIEWILNVSANALVHGTLVFVVAVMADRLVLRRRVSAQARYRVFLGVLFLFLVPGFWDLRLPEAESGVVPAVVSEVFLSGGAEKGMMPGNGEPSAVAGSGNDAGGVAWFSAALGWSLVWAIGCFGMLWHLWMGRRRMRNVIHASCEDEGVVWTDSVGPCVTGCWRPVVLVPENYRSFSDEEMAWILAHERTHIERGDLWAQVVQQMVLSVLWFHPLVWWTHRHINRLREFAVDAAVTRGREDRSAYCEVLVRVASMMHQKPFWGAGLAMASSPGSSKQRLEERIRNCLSPSVGRRGWCWLALVFPVLLLGIPGGCQTGSPRKTVGGIATPLMKGAEVQKHVLETPKDIPEELLEEGVLIQVSVLFMQVLKSDVPETLLVGLPIDVAEVERLAGLSGSDMLSMPTVLTKEDESVQFVIGRVESFPADGTNDVEYVDTGVFVDVVARLEDDQPESGLASIMFEIDVKKTDLVDRKTVRSREFLTTLVAASGTTLLAGRMEDVDEVTIEDVSLGGLFRSKTVEKVERTTLVFVTPMVVDGP